MLKSVIYLSAVWVINIGLAFNNLQLKAAINEKGSPEKQLPGFDDKNKKGDGKPQNPDNEKKTGSEDEKNSYNLIDKKENQLQNRQVENDELPFLTPKIEKRKNVFGDKKEKDSILDKLEYRIGFLSEAGIFNNADLRQLDISNTAAIDTTDDRISLALSRFYLNFFFPLREDLYFRVDIFKNGFWGHDQLSGASTNNDSSSTLVGSDPFAIGELYLDYVAFKNSVTDLSLRLGRQFFSIGGIDEDFFLRDYLDALTMNFAHSYFGNLRLMVIDFYQMAGDPTRHINYVSYFSHDNERVENFDGDVNVVRTGFVYDSPNFLFPDRNIEDGGLQLRAYFFYARYGAVNGEGADRTSGGTTGNFADNDFTLMSGLRLLFNESLAQSFADFAFSYGVDRRLETAGNQLQDINTNGFAVNLGSKLRPFSLEANTDLEAHINLFYASGGSYDDQGVQTSHGFVSFKGSQAGGLLVNRYWGLHPSAYTDDDGFDDTPHDYDRKAGLMFFQLGVGLTFFKSLTFMLEGWSFLDTADSQLDTTTVSAKTEKAQQRFGKYMGTEADLTIHYKVNGYWALFYKTAMFFPGEFYHYAAIKDDSPAGTDRFWGMQLGSTLVF